MIARGWFFPEVPVKDPKGNELRHRVAVVQALGLESCSTVLVCPISTKQDPSIHRRLPPPISLLGLVEPQEGIEERSYFHVHRVFPCSRKKLATKPVRLTDGNLASLELAMCRVLGLP